MNVSASWPADILERMVAAVEKVNARVDRTAKTLEGAQIPYGVIGGNAVGAWVAKIDEGAVRNTRDVDILIRREDFDRVKTAMEAAGFIFGNAYGVDFFLDGPDAKPSESVRLVYAGEKVKQTDLLPAPDVTETEQGAAFRVLSLESLVRMKLVSYRLKDQVHLQDLAPHRRHLARPLPAGTGGAFERDPCEPRGVKLIEQAAS